MKKLMFIVASLFLATSIVSANPTSKVDFASMSKTDTQFLFDGSTSKVVALSSEEMKETEGEWIWFAVRIALPAIRYYAYGSYSQGHPMNGGWNHWSW